MLVPVSVPKPMHVRVIYKNQQTRKVDGIKDSPMTIGLDLEELTILARGQSTCTGRIANDQNNKRKGGNSLHTLESRMTATFSTESPSMVSFGNGPAAYICAKLWECSDLMPGAYIQELQASLFSQEAAYEAHDLWHLESPWFAGQASHTHSLWSQEVFEAMQLKTLGRMLFPVILQHICMQFISDPVSAVEKLAPLALHLEAWTTEDAWEQVERQILLKELRIGSRAKDLPMWTGHIVMYDMGNQRDLSFVCVRLRVQGANMQEETPHMERVAYFQATNMDLSDHGDLLEVPEDVRRFKEHVLVIRVSSPYLVALPEWLGDLAMIEELNLHGCVGLTGLPERMGDLKGLKELDLAGCEILKELPERLGDLTGLQKLNLEGCQKLEGLPERLGDLMGLKELNLKNCKGLRGLPEQLGYITGLEKLNLELCTGLIGLPGRLGDLNLLKKLKLSGCWGLMSLPERLGNLTGLNKLHLVGCHALTVLPERLGDLVGLRTLNLASCTVLIRLPERLWDLTGLKTLNLGGCKGLTILTELLGA